MATETSGRRSTRYCSTISKCQPCRSCLRTLPSGWSRWISMQDRTCIQSPCKGRNSNSTSSSERQHCRSRKVKHDNLVIQYPAWKHQLEKRRPETKSMRRAHLQKRLAVMRARSETMRTWESTIVCLTGRLVPAETRGVLTRQVPLLSSSLPCSVSNHRKRYPPSYSTHQGPLLDWLNRLLKRTLRTRMKPQQKSSRCLWRWTTSSTSNEVSPDAQDPTPSPRKPFWLPRRKYPTLRCFPSRIALRTTTSNRQTLRAGFTWVNRPSYRQIQSPSINPCLAKAHSRKPWSWSKWLRSCSQSKSLQQLLIMKDPGDKI